MAVDKRITDLTSYTSVLPYDSEMFGVYQPMLGWKSKRIARRFSQGLKADQASALKKLLASLAGVVNVTYRDDGRIDLEVDKGSVTTGRISSFDSVVLQQVAARLPAYSAYKPEIWPQVINEGHKRCAVAAYF